MSNTFSFDKLVYNSKLNFITIYGYVNTGDIGTCFNYYIKMQIVISNGHCICERLTSNPEDTSISLYLIFPNEHVNGTLTYDSVQFITANGDNPIIKQVIPYVLSNQNITIKLPTQKVISSKALTVSCQKCIEYFTCDEYLLEFSFPLMSSTAEFNFGIIIKTKPDSECPDCSPECNNVNILPKSCGGGYKTNITITDPSNYTARSVKIIYPKSLTPLPMTDAKVICFYPFNSIKTNSGWKYVKNLVNTDFLVTNVGLVKINQIFKIPQFNVIPFIKFSKNGIKDGVPINDCYLTGEHFVSTDYGNFNANEYYNLFNKTHKIEQVDLYTDFIYSIEVVSLKLNIYCNYDGLSARVWSINEKNDLKKQLDRFKIKYS